MLLSVRVSITLVERQIVHHHSYPAPVIFNDDSGADDTKYELPLVIPSSTDLESKAIAHFYLDDIFRCDWKHYTTTKKNYVVPTVNS
jgi:hypothetical protein